VAKHPNPKREEFCQQYMVDRNGADAARRAGYAAKNAGRQAHQMLNDPLVKARIDELTEELNKKTGLSAEKVIREYMKVAFGSLSAFFRIDHEGMPVWDLTEATEEQLSTIAEITNESHPEGEGDTFRVVTKVKVKMYDKMKALHDLGTHLGLWKPKENPVDAFAQAIIDISKRGSTAPIASEPAPDNTRPDGQRLQ